MKFRVYGIVTGSKYLGEVEADTAEEAEEKAWRVLNCHMPSLCHSCTDKAGSLDDISELELEEVEESAGSNE